MGEPPAEVSYVTAVPTDSLAACGFTPVAGKGAHEMRELMIVGPGVCLIEDGGGDSGTTRLNPDHQAIQIVYRFHLCRQLLSHSR
jgi:hypothetical protein